MSEKYNKFLPEILDDFKPTLKELRKDLEKYSELADIDSIPPLFSLAVKKYLVDSFIKGDYLSHLSRSDISEIIHTSLLVPYFSEKKDDRKIYVIQKDFFSRFKKIDMRELRFQHLPQNMTGYVELPETIKDEDGMNINGFFFYIGDIDKAANPVWHPKQQKPYIISNKVIGFSYFSDTFKENAFSWTHVPEDLSIRVVDSHKDVKVIVSGLDGIKEDVTSTYPEHLAIMYNLLAYLNTGDPDIRNFKNNLRYQSSTSTKPIKADKHLSNSNIIQVGFSFKKENLSHVDEWYSMPYMRWQKCGAGLMDIKLVYVKGSIKHRK